jgi:D-glycero-alpha-D-manno-heptose-7-phosphate kinase
MIISKTPFRISFFGGGTDYPSWVKRYGGKVISTSIDKYCYISIRNLPPFFDHKHRIVYSKIENVKNISEIKHPAVNAILSNFKVDKGIEIHHDGDLPARSGLGSSSSFCVGLINTLYAMNGQAASPQKLADEAIYTEQILLNEMVGFQDQIATAFGGFNKINFFKDSSYSVEPVIIENKRKKNLDDNLLLFFTGFSRIASEIAKVQDKNLEKNTSNLHTMSQMTIEAELILNTSNRNLNDFGRLLHEGWILKKSLSSSITNEKIDDIYDIALSAGAEGGKVLGAGGGGFILFYAEKKFHSAIKKALRKLVHVPFNFDNLGSKIVVYNPNGL